NFHRAFSLRLDANAAIKAARKGIMYDVRRRTSRVTTWAYRLAPAAQATQFQDEEEKEEKDEGEKLFLRPSSSPPSIHLARPGHRNEKDTRARACIESSLSRVGTKREVGINWEGSLREETNTPRHQARAGPFRKPVLDSPLDPPSFLSTAPGSRSILDELSGLAFAQKNEITSERRAYTPSPREFFLFFFFFFFH
ncbi:hypothetical protein K0M31_017583, partial [Melipona bicolor]